MQPCCNEQENTQPAKETESYPGLSMGHSGGKEKGSKKGSTSINTVVENVEMG
jgi:hypothetical protein